MDNVLGMCPLNGLACPGMDSCTPAVFAHEGLSIPLQCPIVSSMSLLSLIAVALQPDMEEESNDAQLSLPGGIVPDQGGE